MILVVNAGSSSVKAALFDSGLRQVLSAQASEIGGGSRLRLGTEERAADLPDHGAAMAAILSALGGTAGLAAAAHRVVHGGADLVAPCRITPAVEAAIDALSAIAPLHNPANLAGIRAVALAAPGLPQYASFDTAFHATIPAVAARYALPPAAEALGIRRYGFHGLSYAAMAEGWAARSGRPLPRRLLAFHLGNGASATAILEGRSVATTMGYSPLAGLTMGTRTGDIDGNAVLRLAEIFGIGGAARMLNRESGLLGLGGASDMRALRAAGTAGAEFAIDHFAYWAVRQGASLAAAMGGVDCIAFTGGIGENDAAMRDRIAAGLAFLNPDVAIATVPAAEERQIAAEAQRLIGEGK